MTAKTVKPAETAPRASAEYIKVMRAMQAKKNRERRAINRALEKAK